MTAAFLALSAYIAGTASLAEPPPYFGWYGSAWTERFEIVRYLNGGSGIRRPVEIPKKTNICNGGGVDEQGRSNRFCGFQLTKPDDVNYTYEIREFASDGTLVRVTGCSAFNNCWICNGETQGTTGSSQTYTMKTPHLCGE